MMNTTKKKISDICDKGTSSLAKKDLLGKSGHYPVYGADGMVGKVDFFQQDKKYIAIIKDGAGVGRVYRFDEKTSILGTMQYILPKDSVDYSFLYYALKSISYDKYIKGAAIPHIYFKDYSCEEIPLPAMEEQKKIAARLDAVSDLLAKQKQLLAEQDTLIQSLFYDMFGDPIKNNKGWKIEKLGNIGTFKNGVNFRSDEDSYKIRCLGVAEFKDLTEIKDISLLPFISVNNELSNDMLLKDGDIVFVRSNGNKNLVGRSVAVYPGETPATFSGFCIRFRKNADNFKTLYAIYFFKNKSVKEKIRGRGANIQNLNQQILSDLSVPLPPLELQEKFAAIVEQIESEKSKIKSAIAETQTLFNALMAEYFEE